MLERLPEAERDPGVEEQYEDAHQQREAARLGVWIFLGTEVLFFGTLLLSYAALRTAYPEAFRLAGKETNVLIGTVNTALLLTSSYAMAAAVRGAEEGEARRPTLLRLGAVLFFGGAFLALKTLEYAEDFRKHLLPGSGQFPIAGPESAPARLFYWLYYAMTGLHALHLMIGLGLVAWCFARFVRSKPGPDRRVNGLRGVGLYWHFVDAVWVVLYPLLYLIDRS